MASSRCLARLIALVAIIFCLFSQSGCKPKFEASPDAVSWQSAERDTGEDAAELGRWPCWRGPNASGVARGGSPPVEFGPAKGARWKAVVPGLGNSSPCVWDDRIFLTTALEGASPQHLAVLCYDRNSGELLWQTDIGEAVGATHIKNGYASATCATDGRHVYASLGGAGLFCLDFSGKQVWRADLGALAHIWGTAASPVLYGNTVIQLCDFDGDSYLVALDKETGEQVWKTPRPSLGCWTTPVLATVDEEGVKRTELIVNGTTRKPSGNNWIIAYNPDDGSELWRVAGTTELVTPTAIVCGGLVFSTSGRNGAIMAIRPGGAGDVTTMRVVWKASRGGPYIPTGLAYRNRLYVLSDKEMLTCYNPGDGQTLWRTRLGGVFTSSLVAADGRIYAVSESGRVSVVKVEEPFELLATNDLRETCYATPAIIDGDLIVRTQKTLYCFAGTKGEADKPAGQSLDETPTPNQAAPAANEKPAVESPSKAEKANDEAKGLVVPTNDRWSLFRGDTMAQGVAAGTLPEKLEVLWTFASQRGGFESTAAIVDGVVYIGCTDGKLYALDLADGKKRWEFSTELGFTASASVQGGTVYIGDSDGRFYAIDAKTGEKRWDFTAENEISGGANFFDDKVLFGSQDSILYCLEAESGKLAWKFECPDQIRCFPSIAGNYTLVAGCDGRLHRIDLRTGQESGDCDLRSPTGAAAAILDNVAFVGTEGNEFLAVDWKEGVVLWRYHNPQRSAGAFRSSAAVTPELVVVGSRDKIVHALDPKTGEPKWTFPTKSRVDSSPVIVGNRVFVGSSDGRIYELDRKTGEERWRFEAGGEVLASPAVASGRLVIGNNHGMLYCFGEKKTP